MFRCLNNYCIDFVSINFIHVYMYYTVDSRHRPVALLQGTETFREAQGKKEEVRDRKEGKGGKGGRERRRRE